MYPPNCGAPHTLMSDRGSCDYYDTAHTAALQGQPTPEIGKCCERPGSKHR
jgi:hypothetical protein